jgi:hypothetical protein
MTFPPAHQLDINYLSTHSSNSVQYNRHLKCQVSDVSVSDNTYLLMRQSINTRINTCSTGIVQKTQKIYAVTSGNRNPILLKSHQNGQSMTSAKMEAMFG